MRREKPTCWLSRRICWIPSFLVGRKRPRLLEHLATLTRNQVRFADTQVTVPMLTEPTSEQRQAFHLIGTPIPLTLT